MTSSGIHTLGFSGFTAGLARLGQHRDQISQSLERLSTGKQINRASDDPSGLITSTKFEARILSLEKQLDGFEREGSFLGAQEGALSVLADLAIELNEVTIQAANTGANTPEEQEALGERAESIISSIDHIHNSSRFQGNTILTGFGSRDLASIQYQTVDPETGDPVSATATLSDLPSLLESDPSMAQELAKKAGSRISSRRGAIGNRINAIETQGSAILAELTNTQGALSQIQDADFASESARLVRSQILEQATIQTMVIQKQQIESMLGLLTPMSNTPDRASTGLAASSPAI